MDDANLLIVDDLKTFHDVIDAILVDLPVNIHHAYDGKQALELLQQNEYAVILMDVEMPNMTGLECLSIIRKNPATSHIPVIVISHIDQRKSISQGYNLGAVDYLVKPINWEALLSKVTIFIDIYQQQKIDQRGITQIQRRHEQLLNYMAEGVIGLTPNHFINFCNDQAGKLLGWPKEQLLGKHIKEFINSGKEDDTWLNNGGITQKNPKKYLRKENGVFITNDAKCLPVEYTLASIVENDEVVGGVLAFQDITERQKTHQKLISLSNYDQLTGLPNRRMYYDFLDNLTENLKRTEEKLAVLFIDVDNFKTVNDAMGHDAGDKLLIQFSRRLKKCIRKSDMVSRIGGDEFAVVLQHIKGEIDSAITAQKILTTMRRPITIEKKKIYVGCSIGIAEYPQNGRTSKSLTKCADTAMYFSKANSGDSYQFFSKEMQVKIKAQMRTANELKQAIPCKQFKLFFQPQFELKNDKLFGLETLIRWKQPERGLIYPDNFIPVAEKTGMILEIGDWVINSAFKQIKAWGGLVAEKHPIIVAVNVSPIQLKQTGFAKGFLNAIIANNIEPGNVELEVTESAIMDEMSDSIRELKTLRDYGVNISIDDFGTGHSSLGYLKQLPIDKLKIDKSFVKDIGESVNGEKIVKAIIALAHNLELKVVAEGVETLQQKEFLHHNNCDYAQGFLLGSPTNATMATKQLKKDASNKLQSQALW